MNEEKFYKDGISKMLSTVHNVDWLLKIYSFIKLFAEDKEETKNDEEKRERDFCNGDNQ